MPRYKLYYLKFRARAELSRLMFVLANVEFEDIEFSYEEWPKYKPLMATGQCPMLEEDGKRLCQSHAIERYLAKKFGLAGKGDWEEALVDQVVMTTEDIMLKYYDTYYPQDPEVKRRMLDEILDVQVPKFLEIFSRLYEENGGQNGYFVGDSITMADLAVHECFTGFLMLRPNIMDKYPKLLHHRTLVESQPRIAEYLKQRPSRVM
ncbi:hypothetical protein KUTeg_021604 [Tegillarca granosa]|uniref:Glutathione transferase n=1 Tax=Tegillarca granosa TaxID=220873 RepID=A0ABQ9E9A5_TEGGR|nr:hypothetical protein KUTeg_021604 [Tegillarca granosa]